MDRLIDRQMANIEKAYESIPMGGKLEFSKSAIEGIYQVLKELKKYEDLIEQGLMIELPCQVGDVVYVINNNSIEEVEITDVHIDKELRRVISWNNYDDFLFSEFGDIVFLTREQAEEKLGEMER